KQLKMQKKLKDFSKEVIYIILRNENDLDNYQGEKYILTNSTKPISIYYALKSVLNLPK
ncbi:MAG: Beta-glucosidase-like glycosyl hydrolase, partial [Petrotoga mobilis]